jgi:hypothetical protein
MAGQADGDRTGPTVGVVHELPVTITTVGPVGALPGISLTCMPMSGRQRLGVSLRSGPPRLILDQAHAAHCLS